MTSKSVVRRSNTPLLTYAVLAVAAVGFFALYIYHRTQPQQRRDSDDENESEETTELQPRRRAERRVIRNQDRELNLTSRLFRGSTTPKKKTMSISMKNVLLWNPSSDPEAPNHAFYENIIPFLNQLTQSYMIHLVCPVNSSQEKEQILCLLRNANLFNSNVIDERRVLFCETQEGKIHIIRHLEANVHVEGGMNGEETVEMVRGFVDKVIWVIQGGNVGNGVWAESSEAKSSVDRNQWNNVEICQNLWTSSLNFEPRNR